MDGEKIERCRNGGIERWREDKGMDALSQELPHMPPVFRSLGCPHGDAILPNEISLAQRAQESPSETILSVASSQAPVVSSAYPKFK